MKPWAKKSQLIDQVCCWYSILKNVSWWYINALTNLLSKHAYLCKLVLQVCRSSKRCKHTDILLWHHINQRLGLKIQLSTSTLWKSIILTQLTWKHYYRDIVTLRWKARITRSLYILLTILQKLQWTKPEKVVTFSRDVVGCFQTITKQIL